MAAKKKTTRSRASAESPKATPSLKVAAAVAGAARRRVARRTAERRAVDRREDERRGQGRRREDVVVAAVKGARKAAKERKAGHIDWSKATRELDRAEVKKVLDKGVSKADALLESAMKWVVKLAIRAKALYDMVSAWWHGKFDLPVGTLQAALVALLYFISPLDLLPDVLPFFGLADDAAVFAFVVSRLKKDLELFATASGKSLADLGL